MGGAAKGGFGRAGDWQCPNTECLNHHKMVFGKNDSCPACGASKPLGGIISGHGNPGDWQCPNADCINHTKMVFAKNDTCPKCFAAKPEGGARARSRSPHGF